MNGTINFLHAVDCLFMCLYQMAVAFLLQLLRGFMKLF